MSQREENSVRHASFEEILDECGCLVWKTEGASMAPLIHTGDLVTIERRPEGPRPLDVALYKQNGRYVLHRVLRAEGDGYRCAGDNTFTTELVPAVQVLGIMTGLIHNGREVKLRSPAYRFYARFWGGNLLLRRMMARMPRGLLRLLRSLLRLVWRRQP